MAVPPKKKPAADEIERPDVELHDDVYFRHETGPLAGRVAAVGKHGCTVISGKDTHKVRWEHFLGHKVKVRPGVKVVDQGEDGFIAETPEGLRRYVHDPVGTKPPAEPEMTKALGGWTPPRLMLFAPREELMKALGPAGRPGLALQPVTDKAGHQTKRWKKTGPEEHKERPKAQPEHEPTGSKHGYGTHNIQPGAKIEFEAGDFKGAGEVVSVGKRGATVKDSSGRAHQVEWAEVRGHSASPGAKAPKATPSPGTPAAKATEKIAPEKFSASEHNAKHDDANASEESVLKHFPPDTSGKIKSSVDRLGKVEETLLKHKKDGVYTKERQALHRKILYEGVTKAGKFYPGLLSPERVEAARPAPGEQPTFMILGGRGGSGKGAFAGEKYKEAQVYDKEKAIVLDADAIKKMMPEYEGWNAHQVHEESSEIFNFATSDAEAQGLNIVHDATMKTPAKAVALVKRFRDAGYRIEAHYMYLPRQEAAKRAIDRFLGETGRLVPPHVVLGNTENEKAFDQVKAHAHKWSFRDNNVPEGTAPKLVSEYEGEPAEKAT